MDNNDLISRAALLKDLSYCAPELWQDEEYIKAKIMKQHAVDAAPVVHGRWLEERPNTYMRKVKCSVCNGPAPFICRSADYYGRNMHGDFAKTKYCPCCGAKMDDERRDSE